MSSEEIPEQPQELAPDGEAPAEAAAGPSLEERLAAAEAEIAALKDQALRALAETENVRRRGERQAAEARVYAIDRFARDLLPVADNLGRALAAAPKDADGAAKTLFEGVSLTERTLIEALSRHGLKQTGAKGEKFDPALHQAVTQIPSDAPAGAIAEVFQPGYMLGERTLRPAMVAVSLGAPAAAPPSSEDEPPREGRIDIKV